mmetsp:Transcript_18490/g.25552  ORF Transcript_18490/g.25552 Transcript_18490/m.25552 type:complete len:172 (+) Transcript_18490:276-791(+)
MLGEGSQGKVALCNYADEADKLFAVKVFSHSIEKEDTKERAVRLGHLQNELNILDHLSHSDDKASQQSQFLVKKHFSVRTQDQTAVALDYCSGGELFMFMEAKRKQRKMLTITETQFYASNVLMGLEHLHKKGVVYKDLKPENILIGDDGYAKLTDFGLSYFSSQASSSSN